MITIKKAERKQIKFKMAMIGPSGSGKTYSALQIASGLGQKILVIDTEDNSASLYSDLYDFDVIELKEPSTETYIEAMKVAEKSSYDVLIIDSCTHQWTQLLEEKTAKDARGGNSFANWASFTPKHNAFIKAILHHPSHVICTVRSKQDYDMSEKGKPVKVGLAPVQRDGFEYEFSLILDMAMDHSAKASKDRTGLFDGKIFRPSKHTGVLIHEWIMSGKAVWRFSSTHMDTLKNICEKINLPGIAMRETCKEMFGGKIESQLDEIEFNSFIDLLQAKVEMSEELQING